MINNPRATKKAVTYINPCDKNEQALSPCHTGWEILVEKLKAFEREDIYVKREACSEEERCELHLNHSDEDVNVKMDKEGIPKYQFTLVWNQGSVDTFLGLPFNIASYALLAKILEKITGMKAKGIVGNLTNVHIYEPHLDVVKEQLSRDINEHSNCELHVVNNSVLNLNPNQNIDDLLKYIILDDLLKYIIPNDFELKGYSSFPRIKAEMLPYNG